MYIKPPKGEQKAHFLILKVKENLETEISLKKQFPWQLHSRQVCPRHNKNCSI